MLPEFVICGAQKSASTFLQNCLKEHPQVLMPRGETPLFESPFYEDIKNIQELELVSIPQHFLEKYPDIKVGIKRPNYLASPEVPGRLSIHIPHAKLIFVLRNPVDRAISAYFHYVRDGFLPVKDIELGMPDILDSDSFKNEYKRAIEVIEFGYYGKYLESYLRFFDKTQILVFLHEDIASDPLSTVKATFEFLDIDSSYIPKSLHSRPQSVVYNIKRLHWLQKRLPFSYLYNVDRTRCTPKRAGAIPLDKFASYFFVGFDKFILNMLLGNEKPVLSESLRSRLSEIYKNDIAHLEKLIGRNLSHWKI